MALAEELGAGSLREGRDRAAGALHSAARRENFPVASRLLPRAARGRVIAFYDFARTADDAADDPRLDAAGRTARLAALERELTGSGGTDGPGTALRAALGEGRAPRDAAALEAALGLLPAFRRDARDLPCGSWDELMDYCDSSAASVGRFLLAVHGEGPAAQRPSDALCAALQVLNHLQDMGEDWRLLGRRYLPGDWMAEEGAGDDDLSRPDMTPALRRVADRGLDRTDALLAEAAALPGRIASRGLRAQAATTLHLARALAARLRRGDPLAGRIALGHGDFARAGLRGLWALR